MYFPFDEYERLQGSLKALFSPPHRHACPSSFLPPKTPQLADKLWESLQLLAPLRPAFVSKTYGAGGSTRDRTHAMRKAYPAGNRADARGPSYLRGSDPGGDRRGGSGILGSGRAAHRRPARRPARGSGRALYTLHGRLCIRLRLGGGLKRIRDFGVSVAAYPETHPEATSPAADLDNLKRKLDAGATRAITQFFFEVDAYLRFLDRVRAAGISVPIVPGILPIANYTQLQRFAGTCGATVPAWLASLFEGSDHNPELRGLLAAAIAAEQCRLLRAAGVEEFHFYTLNRAKLTLAICHILGLRAPLPARP